MKLLLTILIALLMTGCATFGQNKDTNIPIAVACKTEDPKEPTYRFNPPYDDIYEATRDLMGDREAALGYEKELKAALKSCK